ncbi:MAG TPA: hypothetical protein PKA57_14735 [Parvibaculum sp.]|uniref:hypothetical protein n=1 Tax=Parvibaculum sp. TaxID=2024848 RepID=UPI002CD3D907|nr:hypothetical protein [Parvibaculum sp.]HMM15876.1 hypothetical protein [Parvibaculum sp.]
MTRTFESNSEAQQWAHIEEGRVAGDEYVDRSVSKKTALAAAIDLYERKGFDASKPNAKILVLSYAIGAVQNLPHGLLSAFGYPI